ncbi:hypothetical protein Z945_3419 [Sulfitobacter noctilucae]|nr:hypothetical protein Z945_3419 [Sulfitobacter noctilucae]
MRWINDLSLSPAEILQTVAANRQQHHDPPRGPKALDYAMQNLAKTKSAGPMKISERRQNGTTSRTNATLDAIALAAAMRRS